jgi:class III signal peptide
MIKNNLNIKKLNVKERINSFKKEMKEIQKIKVETAGQGAAEYILLFGGVIVIAIAALMIYRSYFANSQTNLNASSDVNDVRNLMNSS